MIFCIPHFISYWAPSPFAPGEVWAKFHPLLTLKGIQAWDITPPPLFLAYTRTRYAHGLCTSSKNIFFLNDRVIWWFTHSTPAGTGAEWHSRSFQSAQHDTPRRPSRHWVTFYVAQGGAWWEVVNAEWAPKLNLTLLTEKNVDYSSFIRHTGPKINKDLFFIFKNCKLQPIVKKYFVCVSYDVRGRA